MPCLVGRSWLAEEFAVTDRDAHDETLELRHDPSVAPQHLGEALLLLSASAYVVLVASILVPVALARGGALPFPTRGAEGLERDSALTRVVAGVGAVPVRLLGPGNSGFRSIAYSPYEGGAPGYHPRRPALETTTRLREELTSRLHGIGPLNK